MNDLISPDVVLPWLWTRGSLLTLIIFGLLFYGWLADRALFEGKDRVRAGSFGPVDLVIAATLAGLFSVLILTHRSVAATPTPADMVAGVIVSTTVFGIIMAGIVGALLARQISCQEVFGLRQAGFAKVVFCAALLLLLAYPLIYVALALTRVLLAVTGYIDDAPQDIVRFLGASGHGAVRAVVAVSAVLLAPVQEEFIFRGYIYGVVKRYAGVGMGILVNAGLFAGIHLHAESFGGLFALAVCLTLAYEWTGSIFVPMAVHALFNSLTVISLLTGGGDNV